MVKFIPKLGEILKGDEKDGAVFAVEVPNVEGAANAARNFGRMRLSTAFELLCLGRQNARFNHSKFVSHKHGLGQSTSCAGLQEIVPQKGFGIRVFLDVEAWYATAVLIHTHSGWELHNATHGECFWNPASNYRKCQECGATVLYDNCWESSENIFFCAGCVREKRVCSYGSKWRPPFSAYCEAVRAQVERLCVAVEKVCPELVESESSCLGSVKFTPHIFTASDRISGKVSFHVTFEATVSGKQVAFGSVHDVRRIVTEAAIHLDGCSDDLDQVLDPQKRLELSLCKLGMTRKALSDSEASPIFDPAPLSNGRRTGKEATRCWRCPLAMKLKGRKHVRPLIPIGSDTKGLDKWLKSLVNVPIAECELLKLKSEPLPEYAARAPLVASASPAKMIGCSKRTRAASPLVGFTSAVQLVSALFAPFHGVPVENMPPNARLQPHSVTVGSDGCIRFRLDGVNSRFCRCKRQTSGSKDPMAHLHRSNNVLHVLDVHRMELFQLCNAGGSCLRKAPVPLTLDFKLLCEDFTNAA